MPDKQLLLTKEEIGLIEWESATLNMSFVDDYPNEVEALLETQLAKVLKLRLGRAKLREIIEFAEKVARAMDNLRSSHVFFVLQQAYGGMEWEEAQAILNRVIDNAPKALIPNEEEIRKEERERIINILLESDVLCSEEDAGENGCPTCRKFWEALKGGK